MKVSRARLRSLERRVPTPLEPLVIDRTIVAPNPVPGATPLNLGVAKRTHVLRDASVTLIFAKDSDGRWTDLVRCRWRQPTWSTHDLIEEFDPPRPESDLPSEPVLDAVTKGCKIDSAEMSQRRKVVLNYGVNLSRLLPSG
jgi:hypothetical protein